MSDELWNTDRCARFLGLSPGTLRQWVSQGKIPYIKIGSAVRFDPDAIRTWVAARAVPARGTTHAFGVADARRAV